MFKIFPFGFSGVFNLNQVGGVVKTLFNNIDISEFSNMMKEEKKDDTYNFISLEEYEDMYLLTIDLSGIDLREMSIRYDPGIIEINLNRSEIINNNLGSFSNTIIKKKYNKEFCGIEDIDTNAVIKNIDNGVLKITMPKKYVIDSLSQIVDIEDYIEK